MKVFLNSEQIGVKELNGFEEKVISEYPYIKLLTNPKLYITPSFKEEWRALATSRKYSGNHYSQTFLGQASNNP